MHPSDSLLSRGLQDQSSLFRLPRPEGPEVFIRWLWIVVLDYRSSYQAAPQGSEKSCKKRNQSSTDESDTAARHQLLHALALCAR